MPIGDPITPPLPVVGEAGTGYASKLLAFLEEVKTRLEAEVPVTALLEGTFDEANNPIVNLQYAGLYDQNGASTPPTGSLYRIGGNLWWVSAAGAFQVTNGAALNATSVNGFTGDYGSPNPAEARFVDLDQRYDFYDDYAGSAWAYVRARGFDVAGGATSLNRCRIAFGGVADYTLTLPAAVPASQALVQMSSAGALTASNALATDTDLVLSGTGKIQHGDVTISVPVIMPAGESITVAGTIATAPGGTFGLQVDPSSKYIARIQGLPQGARVKSVTFHRDSGGGSVTYGFGIQGANNSPAPGLVAVTGSPSTAATVTITVDSPGVFGMHSGADVQSVPYFLIETPVGVTALVYQVAVTYDIPA